MFSSFQTTALIVVSSGVWYLARSRRASNRNNIAGPPSSSLSLGYFLIVKDPKALYHILIKDQEVFEESDVFLAINKVLFGHGLVSTIGEDHRKQRRMMNPVFSVKHLRGMTPTFYTVACELKDALLARTSHEGHEFEMVSWLTRGALELIGRSGLGHSFEDFDNNTSSIYASAVKDLSPALFSLSAIGGTFAPYIVDIGSPRFRRFLVKATPWPVLNRLQEIADIMWQTSCNIFELKKETLNDNLEEEGADLMNILLKANNVSSEEDRMSDEDLIGQMSTFIFAATDTTSGALSRILHLLALHPEVQQKLRQEIVDATEVKGGNLDYDELTSLPYLDALCRETLRVFPPLPSQFRSVTRDAVVPLAFPVRGADGQEMHEFKVTKDDTIIVSIATANQAKEIWGEDAGEWKPERWLSPLPESVTGENKLPGIYSHMMTFLGGGRACIGFKFSQLEIKTVLAVLLQSLEFGLAKDKNIDWKMGIFMTPFVEGSTSKHGELPLLVRAL